MREGSKAEGRRSEFVDLLVGVEGGARRRIPGVKQLGRRNLGSRIKGAQVASEIPNHAQALSPGQPVRRTRLCANINASNCNGRARTRSMNETSSSDEAGFMQFESQATTHSQLLTDRSTPMAFMLYLGHVRQGAREVRSIFA